MRFYDGSFDALIKAAHQPTPTKRCLFLVPEVKNTHDVNAIMLSNGKQKIASVSAADAPAIRLLFENWRREVGYDEVIVVDFVCEPLLKTSTDIVHFKRLGSIRVEGLYRVHERLARKFATSCA